MTADAVPPVRERPILFSAPMVRGILEDRKTKTRRLVKVQTGDLFDIGACVAAVQEYVPAIDPIAGMVGRASRLIRCPYGVPGDRLWVREEFSGPWRVRDLPPRDWKPGEWPEARPIWYWADGDPSEGDWTRPRPSIHMPRWASRITLRITDVRVERLNDCSEADAIAEGVVWSDRWQGFIVPGVEHPNRDFPVLSRATAREMYAALWDAINGSGAWLANPWVWALTFERA